MLRFVSEESSQGRDVNIENVPGEVTEPESDKIAPSTHVSQQPEEISTSTQAMNGLNISTEVNSTTTIAGKSNTFKNDLYIMLSCRIHYARFHQLYFYARGCVSDSSFMQQQSITSTP